MTVSSTCPRLVFSHCVNCVLYKIYPTTVLQYSSSTTLKQTANLWGNVCIYDITTLVMLPNISKTGDTTLDYSFHNTRRAHSSQIIKNTSDIFQSQQKRHHTSRIITVIQNCLNTNSTKLTYFGRILKAVDTDGLQVYSAC